MCYIALRGYICLHLFFSRFFAAAALASVSTAQLASQYMSALPIELNVTFGDFSAPLALAAGRPLVDGAAAWAEQHKLSAAQVPQLMRALEAEAGAYLAVATNTILFDNTSVVTWQFVGETSEAAALRTAVSYGLHRSPRVDRYLRTAVNLLRASLGATDELPRIKGAPIASETLRLSTEDASVPGGKRLVPFEVEVFPEETAVEAVAGFLRRLDLETEVEASVQQVCLISTSPATRLHKY